MDVSSDTVSLFLSRALTVYVYFDSIDKIYENARVYLIYLLKCKVYNLSFVVSLPIRCLKLYCFCWIFLKVIIMLNGYCHYQHLFRSFFPCAQIRLFLFKISFVNMLVHSIAWSLLPQENFIFPPHVTKTPSFLKNFLLIKIILIYSKKNCPYKVNSAKSWLKKWPRIYTLRCMLQLRYYKLLVQRNQGLYLKYSWKIDQ